MFDDGQPEAGTTLVAGPAGIDSVESLEDSGEVFRRDPRAGVDDAEANAAVLDPGPAGDGAGSGGMTNGIFEQVSEDLPERVRVGSDGARVGAELDRKLGDGPGGRRDQAPCLLD